jgi:Heavy metal binding domain
LNAGVTWNYTTVLNILFLVLAVVLVIRALRTGVVPMLRVMDELPDERAELDAPESDQAGYVCPMHPEVRASSPGRCPKCGMHLELR